MERLFVALALLTASLGVSAQSSVNSSAVSAQSSVSSSHAAAVVGTSSSASPSTVVAALTPSPSPTATLAASQLSSSAASPALQNSAETSAPPQLSPSSAPVSSSTAAPAQSSSEASPIAPSPTTVVVTSSPAAPATTKVEKEIKAEIKLNNKIFTNDLKNKSSDEYKKLTEELQEGVKAALKNDKAEVKDVSFSNGSVIANFTITVEEEVAEGASPTNFLEVFRKAVQSGSFGNFTVDSSYIKIEEKFDDDITVSDWSLNTDTCKTFCCKDGILNLEINQTRTCTGDTEKCKYVLKTLTILCDKSPCAESNYCESAGVSLQVFSPLLGLFAVLLVLVITG